MRRARPYPTKEAWKEYAARFKVAQSEGRVCIKCNMNITDQPGELCVSCRPYSGPGLIRKPQNQATA